MSVVRLWTCMDMDKMKFCMPDFIAVTINQSELQNKVFIQYISQYLASNIIITRKLLISPTSKNVLNYVCHYQCIHAKCWFRKTTGTLDYN